VLPRTMATTADPLVRLSAVSKTFGEGATRVTALRDVSFDLHRGDFVAITGPSGSGKSTLMNLIGCLDTPSTGRLLIAGENTAALADDALAELRGRTIGFVFQSFNLLPRLTALQNVALPLSYASRLSPRERTERAAALLERVGLGDRMHHVPAQLSGGQRQRVAIARALVNDPPLLLADEPTGNLDTETGRRVMEMFHDLHREGRTIVLVTHDRKLAEETQRVIPLRDGRIIPSSQAGAP